MSGKSRAEAGSGRASATPHVVEEARASWQAYLDFVEQRLAVQERAVRGLARAPRGPEPAPPLLPMPPELAPKAGRLLSVTRALTELGQDRRARLGALRRAIRQHQEATPLYVDERA